jgi:hypothetical protein
MTLPFLKFRACRRGGGGENRATRSEDTKRGKGRFSRAVVAALYERRDYLASLSRIVMSVPSHPNYLRARGNCAAPYGRGDNGPSQLRRPRSKSASPINGLSPLPPGTPASPSSSVSHLFVRRALRREAYTGKLVELKSRINFPLLNRPCGSGILVTRSRNAGFLTSSFIGIPAILAC